LLRTISLVTIAMLAFAANSLLCRMALAHTSIDPASFTVLRLVSGAISLVFLSVLTKGTSFSNIANVGVYSGIKRNANILGGITLFVYAICFSFAYISMSTGTGALLLFGAVQLTMILVGFLRGERFEIRQWVGFVLAFIGLIVLLLPSASAPSPLSGAIMVLAGIAWGAYSLLGKKSESALLATTGNFIYASLLCTASMAALFLLDISPMTWDKEGVFYALASGVLASGCGYAIWYSVLPAIKSVTAATVQLSVPVIAAIMGWAALSEPLTLQVILASVMTLGGIYLVIRKK